MGACGRILSCLALNATVSREPGSDGAYPILKAPECGSQEPKYVLNREMRRVGLTDGEILSAYDY
jgi:hypothetical protein